MAILTAGLRCASLSGEEATTPTKTASAQPSVMTIQPELFPLVPLSSTLATTPSPKSTSNAVPINSPRNGFMNLFSGDRFRAARHTARDEFADARDFRLR